MALFRSLFVGRDDVYAQRWEKHGRKGWYPELKRLPGQTWQEVGFSGEPALYSAAQRGLWWAARDSNPEPMD
jgi:hypothetical protein